MLCIRLYHKQYSADIVFDSLKINILVLPVLIEVTGTDVDRCCFKARSNDRNIAEGAEVFLETEACYILGKLVIVTTVEHSIVVTTSVHFYDIIDLRLDFTSRKLICSSAADLFILTE